MKKIPFGKTGLTVTHTGFGALPIQRVPMEETVRILRAAQAAGITFFDTARAYSDSEEKVGNALSPVRAEIVIATKSGAKTGEGLRRDLAESLSKLKTDYIDIYQFHNPPFVPRPGGEDGLYDAALEAKRAGKIRHIGITQHSYDRALEAVDSGLYESLQYPFNHLAEPREEQLVRRCEEKGVGFIAMKALSGGLITDASVPYYYLREFGNVVPIWGVQRMEELEDILKLSETETFDEPLLRARIEADRAELSGAFCRGCGYCMPCPVGIPINMANRMTQLITRSPSAPLLTDAWRAQMERIELCTACGACEKKCPYHLKPYETLRAHLEFYRAYR
jgi:aryl-alcohol dehydrogenase-like predicted oxidoreductase